MIDTHSHIHGKEFTQDFDDLLQRAADAGVTQIAMVGVNNDDVETALAAARKHPGRLSVIAGLHPHEAKLWSEQTAARLKQLITENSDVVVAVGEMGVDYHYDFAPVEVQKQAFRGQLELAWQLKLPISIHCREAYGDCLAMLREFYRDEPLDPQRPRGVIHCWFGTPEQAREAVELGFVLGIGGACTFKKADELHRVVRDMPLEALVLETDAPYMAPVPYRGKRNESSYLTYVRDRIAELRGISADEVEKATTANAKRLFGWND